MLTERMLLVCKNNCQRRKNFSFGRDNWNHSKVRDSSERLVPQVTFLTWKKKKSVLCLDKWLPDTTNNIAVKNNQTREKLYRGKHVEASGKERYPWRGNTVCSVRKPRGAWENPGQHGKIISSVGQVFAARNITSGLGGSSAPWSIISALGKPYAA